MKTPQSPREAPEIASFTRYYEHDGMLRAYANRAMFLAILFAVIALSSLAGLYKLITKNLASFGCGESWRRKRVCPNGAERDSG